MMERPSRRALMSPAPARTFRLAERVLARLPVARAISPAAMPSGPARTSRRKTSRRPGWASAERALTADCGSTGSADGRDGGLRPTAATGRGLSRREDGRFGAILTVGDGLAEGIEGLPTDTGRVGHPVLVR